jgi:hypothetical protein
MELQGKIFYLEERDIDDVDWSSRAKQVEYRKNYGLDDSTNKHYVAINTVQEHLAKLWTEVGKILYFNKNYTGRDDE